MLHNYPYKILLASNSPRRQELLSGLDIEYSTFVKKDIDESFSEEIAATDVASYLSKKKADAYQENIKEGVLIITADTIVIQGEQILGKPESKEEAFSMIKSLASKKHAVITGVSLTSKEKQHSFSSITEVEFSALSDEEINYYIDKYEPYDKAGAYGIQEWIGYIGVQHINGSYFNVMGLPVQQLYQELKSFVQ